MLVDQLVSKLIDFEAEVFHAGLAIFGRIMAGETYFYHSDETRLCGIKNAGRNRCG